MNFMDFMILCENHHCLCVDGMGGATVHKMIVEDMVVYDKTDELEYDALCKISVSSDSLVVTISQGSIRHYMFVTPVKVST